MVSRVGCECGIITELTLKIKVNLVANVHEEDVGVNLLVDQVGKLVDGILQRGASEVVIVLGIGFAVTVASIPLGALEQVDEVTSVTLKEGSEALFKLGAIVLPLGPFVVVRPHREPILSRAG